MLRRGGMVNAALPAHGPANRARAPQWSVEKGEQQTYELAEMGA